MIKPYLSVIIPAYNELNNFKNGSLNKVFNYLKRVDFEWEVIVVDDQSTDGSSELIENFCNKHKGFKFVSIPHMGKVGGVATGVKKAKGKYLLFTDFDQATPLSEWEKLEPYLKKNYHVVIGSREVTGSRRDKEPFYRHMMGRGFNFGVRLLTVRGIHDTQCGFKAFDTKLAKRLFQKLYVYKPKKITSAFTGAFDVEVLFIAKKMGYKLAEVPIHWSHVETDRVSPIKDSLLMAIDVVKIRFADMLGKYK